MNEEMTAQERNEAEIQMIEDPELDQRMSEQEINEAETQMEAKQLRELKDNLEDKIFTDIMSFYDATGIMINNVRLELLETENAAGYVIERNYNVRVNSYPSW